MIGGIPGRSRCQSGLRARARRALLDDLAKVVRVDMKRVYATGVLMGAIIVCRLALELSDRIAAIAPMGMETCHRWGPVPVPLYRTPSPSSSPDRRMVLRVREP